jgi:hypothetical protein
MELPRWWLWLRWWGYRAFLYPYPCGLQACFFPLVPLTTPPPSPSKIAQVPLADDATTTRTCRTTPINMELPACLWIVNITRCDTTWPRCGACTRKSPTEESNQGTFIRLQSTLLHTSIVALSGPILVPLLPPLALRSLSP